MKSTKFNHAEELLIQIRDALVEGNADRKSIKGYERSISQHVKAIQEGRTGSEARLRKDPLSPIQRSTVDEVKHRYRERRAANPNYSLLSIAKEILRDSPLTRRPLGYDDVYSLNHRAYLEIKREDVGLPPF